MSTVVGSSEIAHELQHFDVGPHQIEIAAPGFEPLLFDVYVDPTRTVDLHGTLIPGRP